MLWYICLIISALIIAVTVPLFVRMRVFKNCISISYLYLPRLVESIGDNAIASIYYYGESSQGYVHARYKGVALLVCNDSFCESYAKEMGIDYIYSVYTCGDFRYMLHYNGEAELCGCTVKDSTIAVPETLHGFPVTSINTSAFDECRETMEKVILPSTVREIQESAFENCPALVDVELPDGLKTVGMVAFLDCPKLKNPEIPSTVTEIGLYAFGFVTELVDGSEYTINITPKFELGITADSASEEYAQSFPKMASYYTDKNYEIGDVNLDGAVNIMDVTYLQLYIASAHDLNKTAKKLSDVNGSGDISIMDATQIQIIIAR